MLKTFFIISLVSFGVLGLPIWTPPYSVFESLIILVAFFGVVGPWFLILVAVLNRLVNISFRIR